MPFRVEICLTNTIQDFPLLSFPRFLSFSLSLSLFCIAFSIDGNVGFTHFYSNSTLKDLPLQYVQYKFLEQSIAKIGL